MKTILTFLSVVMCLTLNAQFTLNETTNKMTGETSYSLETEFVKSVEAMNFPYQDVMAKMMVLSDGNVGFGFTALNLNKGELKERGEEYITSVKMMDVAMPFQKMINPYGTKVLIWENGNLFSPNFHLMDKLMIELDWYENGKVYFEFDISNYAEINQKMDVHLE